MAGDSQTSQSPDSPPPENPEQSSQEEQQQPQRRRRKPKHDFPQTQAGKLWDAFGNPEEPINTMPGGTYNTAGGRPREYTWRDVFSLTKEDANRFWRTGCANDALTVGMLGGAGVMGARFIWGGWSWALLSGLSSMLNCHSRSKAVPTSGKLGREHLFTHVIGNLYMV